MNAYKEKILRNVKIHAPLLESISFNEKEEIGIRTLDGRHRIAAAKVTGIPAIYVCMRDDLALKIELLFPGVILRKSITEAEQLLEKDQAKLEEEDLLFFKKYMAEKKNQIHKTAAIKSAPVLEKINP